jgi:predicted DNA-binding protein (MmcQ/YjbR family)
MTLDEYQSFCGGLPATTHVVQWGGSHVWKVGGKVFAVGGWAKDSDDDVMAVSFKCSDIVFEVLRDAPGCRPAPYLASRGMTWIQCYDRSSVSTQELKGHIEASHALVAAKLTKKKRAELGLSL